MSSPVQKMGIQCRVKYHKRETSVVCPCPPSPPGVAQGKRGVSGVSCCSLVEHSFAHATRNNDNHSEIIEN